ncbi:MAG: EscU/YscU/HrcU family type III secretion system export apparatus switch protein [Spirochaetaceae bacterium]|nr:EscU/YscU/HrcU family type III secretion system export apparatus switch protein [Spirochaetaceae bacterium]
MKQKALAIKYDERLPAPFVLAKGEGRLAEIIVRIAEKAGVPVVARPVAAEKLFYLEAGSFIPEECFEVVAEMLVYVHSIERGLRKKDLGR